MTTETKTRKPTPEELEMELDAFIGASILAIVKAEHDTTGKFAGSIACPRCKVGTLAWSIAECNVHARAVCNRVIDREHGFRCVNIIQ